MEAQFAAQSALFIDTETTGRDPYSARLVELAALLIKPDGQVEAWETLVRPVDWVVPWDAERVHGISTEQAHAQGLPLTEALAELSRLASEARPGLVVGHNLAYDFRVLGSEYKRTESRTYPLNFLTPFCTMVALTDRMQLPNRYASSYKWPRLEEAYLYCLGEPMPPGHRAMRDVLACKAVYDHGRAQGWWHSSLETPPDAT